MNESKPNVRDQVQQLISNMSETDRKIFKHVLLIEQKYLHVETMDSQIEIMKCVKDEVSNESSTDGVNQSAIAED